MMRSLYSGVSGLRVHQTRMDVIGANLANVNTVGFKSSRVTFRDVLYQTIANPGTPSADAPTRGGTNPSQIGLGVNVASIDVLMTRAGPMLTDKPTDVYIDGEGFFLVTDASENEYYTRVGDFRFDGLGRLVDGNGNFVMGVLGDRETVDEIPEEGTAIGDLVVLDLLEAAGGPEEWARLSQISIGTDGIISAYDPLDDGSRIVLGQIAICKFVNNEGLSQEGNSYWRPTRNTGDPDEPDFNPRVYAPGIGGVGRTIANRLEMSNVELSKEFTDMIVTQRGFQANSRIITVSDEMIQELVNLKR